MVEEKWRADLGASAAGTDADEEVGLWLCGGASLVFDSVEQIAVVWASFSADPSWLAFLRPSRWAWNVMICCSTERKLSCTLSNCRYRTALVWLALFSAWKPSTHLLDVGLKQQLGPHRFGAAAAPARVIADVLVAPSELLRKNCCLSPHFGEHPWSVWSRVFTCSSCVLSFRWVWQHWSLFQ